LFNGANDGASGLLNALEKTRVRRDGRQLNTATAGYLTLTGQQSSEVLEDDLKDEFVRRRKSA